MVAAGGRSGHRAPGARMAEPSDAPL